MATPGLLDHVLVVALIVVLPVHGAYEYRRLVRRVRAGDPDARVRQYRATMIMEWLLAAGLVGWWLRAGRSAQLLGFTVPGGVRLIAGVAVTALGLALLYAQLRAGRRLDEEGLEALRKQIEPVAEFLPRTDREAGLFRGLSVTAGICEEIVFRGYLIWYVAAFVGEWPAVAIAAVVFGAVHIYQRMAGALRTGAIGFVTGVLYVGTGSLLWPMILHAAIDLQGGALARRVLERSPDHRTETAPNA